MDDDGDEKDVANDDDFDDHAGGSDDCDSDDGHGEIERVPKIIFTVSMYNIYIYDITYIYIYIIIIINLSLFNRRDLMTVATLTMTISKNGDG